MHVQYVQYVNVYSVHVYVYDQEPTNRMHVSKYYAIP